MVILGLVLLVLGAAAILSAVFGVEVDGDHVRLIGLFDISPLTLFLIGLGAGLAIWFGFTFLRWGLRRSRARRKDQKRLGKLADQVEQVERRDRGDGDDLRSTEDSDRRTL